MKIASSQIAMSGSHNYIEKHEKAESLKMWIGPRNNNLKNNIPLLNLQDNGVNLRISDEGLNLQQCNKTEESEEISLSDKDKLKINLVEAFVKMLTGKKIKIAIPKISKDNLKNDLENKIAENNSKQPANVGWGLEYDYHQVDYEYEKTSFSAEGLIKTADGKTINFQVNLNMSREFLKRTDISLRMGDAKKVDPLVINFNGNSAQLTETKFSFDLDLDGNEDQISFVGQNSGILALDSNNDGTINSGLEVFGPQSGDGFKELSQYDSDKNGWIDENDPIYQKLRIWTKDENGKDILFALGQKGIGAIYLQNVDTPFKIKDSKNNENGQVASTGIYVKEDGSVGTIQHIDLAV